MSVILFSKNSVYQTMADSYEGLKEVLRKHYYACTPEDDKRFYQSLRRLYFANVATFLCQYHSETPKDLASLKIDPFVELQGTPKPGMSAVRSALSFLEAWGSLQYNLMTNDGERFIPHDAYDYLTDLAERISEAALKTVVANAN